MYKPSQNNAGDKLQSMEQKQAPDEASGINLLHEWSTPRATFEPDARLPPPVSFPATREQYIEDITLWASPSPGIQPYPSMYWMKGEKGVGKSMVAHTCVEKLSPSGHVGAMFSFSIDACDDHSRLFPSIAHQLSTELPEYRTLLDKRIRLDGGILQGTMKSQFRELIVEPLRELRRSGEVTEGKVIFVDGLNECKDTAAQSEIIEIVATSVQECSTPFLWAFFSQPEPQIEATFAKPTVAPFCHSVQLPVSQGADGEIDAYLRNELQNILRRRGIPMNHSWPSESDLKALVVAAKGQFVYAATLLRLMNQLSSLREQEELLCNILGATSHSGHNGTSGPSADQSQLDALYALILHRIDPELLPSIRFLLASLTVSMQAEPSQDGYAWGTLELGNQLRFSEAKFKRLYGELQALLRWTNIPHPKFENHEAVTISIHDAKLFPLKTVRAVVVMFEGYLTLHHNSFYEFIIDPKRSGTLCVDTHTLKQDLFEHHVQLQLDYSQNYYIQNGGLVPLPRARSAAATALSWPHKIEFISSYLRVKTFNQGGGFWLHQCFPFDWVKPEQLERLAELDHRKYLFSQLYVFEEGVLSRGINLGSPCFAKNVRGTMLCRVSHADFHHFDSDKFYRGIARLENSKVIQPYFPDLASRLKGLFHDNSQNASPKRLYTKGYGSKKTFWFWEVNTKLGYYQHFETADLAQGEKIYREENFNLWNQEALPQLESLGEKFRM